MRCRHRPHSLGNNWQGLDGWWAGGRSHKNRCKSIHTYSRNSVQVFLLCAISGSKCASVNSKADTACRIVCSTARRLQVSVQETTRAHPRIPAEISTHMILAPPVPRPQLSCLLQTRIAPLLPFQTAGKSMPKKRL